MACIRVSVQQYHEAYERLQRPGQRPQSGYYDARGYGNQALATRTRSQSQGTQRRFTKDGRPILHYCECNALLIAYTNLRQHEQCTCTKLRYQRSCHLRRAIFWQYCDCRMMDGGKQRPWARTVVQVLCQATISRTVESSDLCGSIWMIRGK